ncbi:hypothetical protein NDU88_000337 [Pleurodeles waltl]|uniref:Uncharacterized protein n=1 Tax=Pleurodeles waltl TaxID=8319 RepID=A0AAV7S6S9_PLEWA|nr:hypothetical protein NDU88_000337 [Pleurodeles waltl]
MKGLLPLSSVYVELKNESFVDGQQLTWIKGRNQYWTAGGSEPSQLGIGRPGRKWRAVDLSSPPLSKCLPQSTPTGADRLRDDRQCRGSGSPYSLPQSVKPAVQACGKKLVKRGRKTLAATVLATGNASLGPNVTFS